MLDLKTASAAVKPGEVSSDARAKERRRLHDAAQQFEAFFTSYLMKEMRKGIGEDKNSTFAPSDGEKIFRDMIDDERGRIMSTTHQIGLADLLIKQLEPTLNPADKDAPSGKARA